MSKKKFIIIGLILILGGAVLTIWLIQRRISLSVYASRQAQELYQVVTTQENTATDSVVGVVKLVDKEAGSLTVADFNRPAEPVSFIKFTSDTAVEQVLYVKDGQEWTFKGQLPPDEAQYLKIKTLDSSWLALNQIIRYNRPASQDEAVTKIQILPVRWP